MPEHDDFCHLCGWWHSGLGRFEHPPLKNPLCDACYKTDEPAFNAIRQLDAEEEGPALERLRPIDQPLQPTAQHAWCGCGADDITRCTRTDVRPAR